MNQNNAFIIGMIIGVVICAISFVGAVQATGVTFIPVPFGVTMECKPT